MHALTQTISGLHSPVTTQILITFILKSLSGTLQVATNAARGVSFCIFDHLTGASIRCN